MYKLALVGRSISHSQSKKMYDDLLQINVNYQLLDYEHSEDIPSLDTLFKDGLDGLSVTAPYKSHFLPEIEFENEKIKELGVINCIRKSNESFIATNTDLLACRDLVKRFREEDNITSVIVLGNGHMAKTVKLLLDEEKVPYKCYFRSKDGDISNLNLSYESEKTLLINCCSRSFMFRGLVGSGTIFWDLNYGHSHHESYFSDLCKYIDGTELLRLQAKYALSFWNISLP